MTFESTKELSGASAPITEENEESDADEEEVYIYHIVGEEENESLETIDDEALLDEVFEEFCKQYDDFEEDEEE